MARWCRVSKAIAVLVAMLWLLTGGLVVHTYWFFSFRSENKEFKPYLRVDALPSKNRTGIPFLFEHFSEGPPLTIRFRYVTHTIVDRPSVDFDSFVIKFSDGGEVNLTKTSNESINVRIDEHRYIDDIAGNRTVPSLMFEIDAKTCINTSNPFSVEVKGHLRSNGKIVEPFSSAFDFAPRYERRAFSTWWWLLASSS
jgi:hypothetical protein